MRLHSTPFKNTQKKFLNRLSVYLFAGVHFFLLLIPILPAAQPLTRFVDPFLGTGGHGHVYPGATVPFGMVQLSPDNGDEGWDWCSGYNYSSNTIAGFSHTHLSGTGIGDWCDISVLPVTDTNGMASPKIKIPFSHKNEKATPGYYSVKLNNGVQCDLTATERAGFHQYKFPGNNGWLRFDMGFHINWDQPTAAMLQIRTLPLLVTGSAPGGQRGNGFILPHSFQNHFPTTCLLTIQSSTINLFPKVKM
jgi:putative alpha-1,2-mannosidase